MNFSGTYTAIITPFSNTTNEIDYPAFTNLIEEQISEKIDGIVVAGTTGESPTLTWEENDEIIKKAVEIANGRIRVIAGTGSNCTREAVEHSQLAEKNGADALLVVTPYYNKPTQNGIYDYFSQVCSSVNIPVIVYNIQGRCGVNIETKTLKKMADDFPNIQGVKEASGSAQQAQEVREVLGTDFPILCGEENLTYPLIKAGHANGVISVMSNSHPKEIKQLLDFGLSGNFEEGDILYEKLLAQMNACFIETNPIPIKTLLAQMGKCDLVFRSPLVEMEEENKNTLFKTFNF